MAWNFIENRAFGISESLAVLMSNVSGGFELIVDERLLVGMKQVSIAVDLEGCRMGVFSSQADNLHHEVSKADGLASVQCSAAALQLGLSPGTYALERGTSGEIFSIAVTGRRGDPLPEVRNFWHGRMTQGRRSDSAVMPERLAVCRTFIERMGRAVRFKDRHNGYQLSVPDGKVFGFIRYNIKGAMTGKFVVYTYWSEADLRNLFKPQQGNPNDLHIFFPPDDNDKANYVIEVLKRAYDLAATPRYQ